MEGQENQAFWVWDIGTVLTCLAISIAIVVGIIAQWYRPFIEATKTRLDTKPGRKAIQAELAKKPSFETYQENITHLNQSLDGFFGSLFSYKAFDQCLKIAFIYPIVVFNLGWLFGASGSMGPLKLLPENLPFLSRLALIGIMVALILFLFFYVKNLNSIISILMDQLFKRHKSSNATKRNFIELFVGALAFWGAFTFALAGAVAVAGSYSGAFAFAFCGVVAGFGSAAGTGAFTFAFAFVFAAAISPAVTDTNNYDLMVFLLLFSVALPLVNALADWVSWAATRYFLKNISHLKSPKYAIWRVLADIGFDIGAAIASLVLLAVLLANTGAIFNAISGYFAGPLIPWQDYLAQAGAAPLTQGLFVNLMLVTTLLPTLLHLTIGLAGVFMAWTPWSNEFAQQIIVGTTKQKWSEIGTHGQDTLLRDQIAQHYVRRTIWYVPAFVVTGVVLYLLMWGLLEWTSEIGWGLAKIAIFSTSWL